MNCAGRRADAVGACTCRESSKTRVVGKVWWSLFWCGVLCWDNQCRERALTVPRLRLPNGVHSGGSAKPNDIFTYVRLSKMGGFAIMSTAGISSLLVIASSNRFRLPSPGSDKSTTLPLGWYFCFLLPLSLRAPTGRGNLPVRSTGSHKCAGDSHGRSAPSE